MTIKVNAERLKIEMAARGLNQGELAGLSGVSAATITRMVQGLPVRERTVRTVALALSRTAEAKGIRELLEPNGLGSPHSS